MRMDNLGCKLDSISFSEKFAVVEAGKVSSQKYTFRELHEQANGVAYYLQAKQWPYGSRIAIIAENSFQFLALYYGILRAGHVVAPLNFKLPKNQLIQIVEKLKPVLIVCNEKFQDFGPAGIERFIIEKDFIQIAMVENFQSTSVDNETTALILHSSGSTGHPKEVELTHESFRWKTQKTASEISDVVIKPGFIHLIGGPFYHMNALASAEVLLTAYSTIVILPQFEAQAFAEAIQAYKVTSITCVPAMLSLLFNLKSKNEYDFSSVKYVNTASAPLSENLFRQIENNFPHAKGNIQNNYGLTEIGPKLFGRHPGGVPVPELSVGFPIAGIDYRVVDGILQIKSPSMIKNKQSVQERMTVDGYYITNDLFRTDDFGFYYYLGRADDMIICGGENVYLSNLEAILECHPGVEKAVVVALEDEIKGQKPFGFVTLKPQVKTSEAELMEYSLTKLPAFAHPRRIWRLTEIPLTSLCKIDKEKLRSWASDLLSNKVGSVPQLAEF